MFLLCSISLCEVWFGILYIILATNWLNCITNALPSLKTQKYKFCPLKHITVNISKQARLRSANKLRDIEFCEFLILVLVVLALLLLLALVLALVLANKLQR